MNAPQRRAVPKSRVRHLGNVLLVPKDLNPDTPATTAVSSENAVEVHAANPEEEVPDNMMLVPIPGLEWLPDKKMTVKKDSFTQALVDQFSQAVALQASSYEESDIQTLEEENGKDSQIKAAKVRAASGVDGSARTANSTVGNRKRKYQIKPDKPCETYDKLKNAVTKLAEQRRAEDEYRKLLEQNRLGTLNDYQQALQRMVREKCYLPPNCAISNVVAPEKVLVDGDFERDPVLEEAGRYLVTTGNRRHFRKEGGEEINDGYENSEEDQRRKRKSVEGRSRVVSDIMFFPSLSENLNINLADLKPPESKLGGECLPVANSHDTEAPGTSSATVFMQPQTPSAVTASWFPGGFSQPCMYSLIAEAVPTSLATSTGIATSDTNAQSDLSTNPKFLPRSANELHSSDAASMPGVPPVSSNSSSSVSDLIKSLPPLLYWTPISANEAANQFEQLEKKLSKAASKKALPTFGNFTLDDGAGKEIITGEQEDKENFKPKKRGRPFSLRPDEADTEVETDTEGRVEPKVAVIKKRGRGRPRKSDTIVQALADSCIMKELVQSTSDISNRTSANVSASVTPSSYSKKDAGRYQTTHAPRSVEQSVDGSPLPAVSREEKTFSVPVDKLANTASSDSSKPPSSALLGNNRRKDLSSTSSKHDKSKSIESIPSKTAVSTFKKTKKSRQTNKQDRLNTIPSSQSISKGASLPSKTRSKSNLHNSAPEVPSVADIPHDIIINLASSLQALPKPTVEDTSARSSRGTRTSRRKIRTEDGNYDADSGMEIIANYTAEKSNERLDSEAETEVIGEDEWD
jgi:hypothetical protein